MSPSRASHGGPAPVPSYGALYPVPMPNALSNALLVDLASAQPWVWWVWDGGWVALLKQCIRPAAVLGNQEHPNEV